MNKKLNLFLVIVFIASFTIAVSYQAYSIYPKYQYTKELVVEGDYCIHKSDFNKSIRSSLSPANCPNGFWEFYNDYLPAGGLNPVKQILFTTFWLFILVTGIGISTRVNFNKRKQLALFSLFYGTILSVITVIFTSHQAFGCGTYENPLAGVPLCSASGFPIRLINNPYGAMFYNALLWTVAIYFVILIIITKLKKT